MSDTERLEAAVEAVLRQHEYGERAGACLGCGFRDEENGWLGYADHCSHVAVAVAAVLGVPASPKEQT